MRKTTEHYECDVCKSNAAAVDIGTKPKGWAVFEREDPMQDRSWIKHAVCPECCDKIGAALVAALPPPNRRTPREQRQAQNAAEAVHAEHCCARPAHGCKYGESDCPVVAGVVRQNVKCTQCARTRWNEEVTR